MREKIIQKVGKKRDKEAIAKLLKDGASDSSHDAAKAKPKRQKKQAKGSPVV